MDTEHQEILTEIQAVLGLVNFKVPCQGDIDRFISLEGSILNHFNHEELLMRQYAYPKLEEHLLEHQRMMSKVRRFNELFYTTGINEKQFQKVEHDIEFWFKIHIFEADRELEMYVNKKQIEMYPNEEKNECEN